MTDVLQSRAHNDHVAAEMSTVPRGKRRRSSSERRRRESDTTIAVPSTMAALTRRSDLMCTHDPHLPSDVSSSVTSLTLPVATYASNDLGDILLTMAKITTICHICDEPDAICRRRRVRTRTARGLTGHWMLLVSVGCMVAAQIALWLHLPARVHQFVGGILLAASAGTSYLLLCVLLYTFDTTVEFGALLLNRSNPLTWQRDRMRFFLEVCSWMASVWYSYTAFQSELLSICGGALAAMGLAVFSDVSAAYVRVLEARVNRQKHNAIQSVAWLKVLLSYLCVGYVITGHWRNLRSFLLSGEMADFQSLEELVFTYLLITLVGVSLIVASELLLLYEPTRNAGMVLQSRIVDARRNWEEHTWRSLREATAVVTTTVVTYHMTQDVLTSLQFATFVGVAVILTGDLLASPFFTFSRPHVHAIPADHWVKLIPLGVIMSYFFVQVVTVAVKVITLPSHLELLMVWLVTILAISLTVVAMIDNQSAMREVAALGRQYGGKTCVVTVTCIATWVCHGWIPVAFSMFLSWFCVSLSRECWNEIEANETRKAALAMKQVSPSVVVTPTPTAPIETPLEPAMIDHPPAAVRGISWSSLVMGYVRNKYSYLYKRVKWTFISIVILSVLDVCSTVYGMVLRHHADVSSLVSLSQFSAANVVLSTGVGYLTSTIRHELRPEVLVRTGAMHFRNKWLLFPLHAFVETMIFLGVFAGTFTTTSTVFSSVTLASLSGIVVSVGGHWVCSKLNLTIGTLDRVQLTSSCALVFCMFLVTWVSFLCLFSIYHHIDSIEAAFCLASLAGVVFLACSELFLLWEPTREIGRILQYRVTHARENWEAEPLRSFLEILTWLAVVCGSFALYDDVLLALQLGTFSGIAVALSGEYFRRKRSKFLRWEADIEGCESDAYVTTAKVPTTMTAKQPRERPRVLPAMLLFAYIGSGTFQWIFENIRSLEVTILLATFAGITFLCIADLLVLYKPTRWAGVILQDRFLRAKDNWNENPVRSFVELGCFLGVIYGSYAIYGDLIVATQFGTLSGMLVTLIGESVRSHARAIPRATVDDVGRRESGEQAPILPLPVMGLLGLVGAVAFNIIYTHLRSIEVAFALATTSGVAFAVLGDMFVIWKPTRKVGLILQERVLYIRYNFKMHPGRTWMELLSCAMAWWVSYQWLWPKDLLVATQFGTFTGIFACVCDELTKEYMTELEKNLLQGAAKPMSDAQENAGFLALPYEVQFQVATYLTPEDLLVTRGTCHRINNMLRAESARYWLHASLRRKFGAGRRQGAATAHHVANQVRSLIYEAIMVIIPKLFSTRDPTNVLTSGIGVSRALKWVYLNADWIRSQNLTPLDPTLDGSHVTFGAGDVAFEVFRHMPDKGYLGIVVRRDEDTIVKQIDVPVAVYTKIQTDPFSFVAAETLSEVDAFSNWHVAFVTFFAMTLIFIGQFSSDVLRERVLPPTSPLWRPTSV